MSLHAAYLAQQADQGVGGECADRVRSDLTLAPWAARDLVAMDAPIITSANGGLVFYLGNGPGATGKHRDIDYSVFSDDSEVNVYREGPRLGFEHILEEPVRWATVLPVLQICSNLS